MANWSPERRKMSVSPQEVELAKRREAVRLLAWSKELDTRRIRYATFIQERRLW